MEVILVFFTRTRSNQYLSLAMQKVNYPPSKSIGTTSLHILVTEYQMKIHQKVLETQHHKLPPDPLK
jgi:hypothetical protein